MYNNLYNMYQPRMQPIQPVEPVQQPQQIQPIVTPFIQNTQPSILGKQVESIEVVKATEVPFDGSTSYFPLSDGSAIITKRIQADGTSKIITYKPVIEKEKETPKYITVDELREAIEDIDLSEIKELQKDLKDLDKRLKDLEGSKKR